MMKLRINEDYYFWCCEWCDTENLILWARLQESPSCGACHRPMPCSDLDAAALESTISAGLC